MNNLQDESYIKMDYSLTDVNDRIAKTNEIIAQTPENKLTPYYLNKLATYILDAIPQQEKKEKKILTDNLMVTVNKRETSFEGLIGKLENGENGIYNMIANDKNIIFRPKTQITQEDIDTIPDLKPLLEEIEKLEERARNARGKQAYALRKQLIEMRKDQYVIRNAYFKPYRNTNMIKSLTKMDLTDHIYFDEDGYPHNRGYVDFFNKDSVSILLCNYAKLKEDSWEKIDNDMKWLIIDLENIIDAALKEKYPLYYDILICKIDGMHNIDIKNFIEQKYNVSHSVEYISSLWRNKIPKLIAEKATETYLEWYYTFKEYGKWKKCSRCGEIKLAHNYFYSKNKTSKDGFYSICKCCRNKKKED